MSMMHNQMGGNWKIVNFENQNIKSKKIYNKQWGVSSPKASEAAIMLHMLDFVTNPILAQLEGELTIANDNKLTNAENQGKWVKALHYANDSGGTLTKIKELIKAMAFDTKFKLITKHKNLNHVFRSNPIRHLIKSCDKVARRVL